MAEAPKKELDVPHLMGHVQDAEYFEVPRMMAPPKDPNDEHDPGGKLYIPQPFESVGTIAELPSPFLPLDLRITKFMVLEVVAAVIVAALFIWLGRKVAAGGAPRGRLWNMLEAMVVFIRDEVARPAIGKHDADRFLPLVWTVFFFVLICNLIGLVPWAGSATGALATTAALALVTFAVVVLSGSVKMGPAGFWKSLVPHMDLPPVMMVFLWPMLFGIELLGLLIKHFVLAVRLFANMMAGHLVLAVIVNFIALTYGMAIWYGVVPASILGATALNLLELLVAFIQAYIFAFLTSLFIGTAVHPH